MNKLLEINIGPLTSINSLHKYIGPKLKELRLAYIKGFSPKVAWNATQLKEGHVSMAGLTAFISIAHNISNFIGLPQKIYFDNKPDLLSFLIDISFVEISTYWNIFEFESEKFSKIPHGKTNPFTKILFYANVIKDDIDIISQKKIKEDLRNKIRPNFNLRCNEIFKGLNFKLENTVSKTAVELVVNSLIHGKSIAFVGLQRTSKRITVSICDSGKGFPKSLRNNVMLLQDKDLLNHTQAILLGCLINVKDHGLRLAINEVINLESVLYKDIVTNDGWVIISSYDTEIRWQKANWLNVLSHIDDNNIIMSVDNPEELLGQPVDYIIHAEDNQIGYWQKFDSFIVGTRIVFEIPVKK